MKMIYLFVFAVFLTIPTGIAAQLNPPPPVPVTETEIRNDSLKMRSAQLERIKRDANKPRPRESSREKEIRFAKIKKDFENIQKLQDQIIKAYTTEKKINYNKISKSSTKMRNDALRLEENLFGENKTKEESVNAKKEQNKQKSVRDLIILLDSALGNFVSSPIFNNLKVVDLEESKKARSQLRKIIYLSRSLSAQADKNR